MKTCVIVHRDTGERKSLAVLRVYPREIELRWPLLGGMRFHCRTGQGIAKHKAWSICPVSLTALHAELGIRDVQIGPIGPLAEPEDGQQTAKAALQMLRVYFCAPGADAARIVAIHSLVREIGIVPTSTWADALAALGGFDPATTAHASPAAMRDAAHKNDVDLLSSHACVVFARDGAGGEMFAEARLAIARGIPVLWCGRKTLSAWREGVERFDQPDDAIMRLDAWNKSAMFRKLAERSLMTARTWLRATVIDNATDEKVQ